jgi:hypothetical protein
MKDITLAFVKLLKAHCVILRPAQHLGNIRYTLDIGQVDSFDTTWTERHKRADMSVGAAVTWTKSVS